MVTASRPHRSSSSSREHASLASQAGILDVLNWTSVQTTLYLPGSFRTRAHGAAAVAAAAAAAAVRTASRHGRYLAFVVVFQTLTESLRMKEEYFFDKARP